MRTSANSAQAQPLRQFHALQPWRCAHLPDRSEINAYVEASGKWETVVIVQPTSGTSAEVLATFIAGLINDHQRGRNLLCDALDTLEAIMQEGLTFATEQDAESVVNRIKSGAIVQA